MRRLSRHTENNFNLSFEPRNPASWECYGADVNRLMSLADMLLRYLKETRGSQIRTNQQIPIRCTKADEECVLKKD